MSHTISTITAKPWRIDAQLIEALKNAKASNIVMTFKSYVWDILVNPDSDINTLTSQFESLLSEEREKYKNKKSIDSNETTDPSPYFNHINSIDNTNFSDIIVLIEWFEKYFELQWLTRNIDKTTIVEKIIETIEKFWYEFNYNPTKEIEDLDWNNPEVIKFTIWQLLENLRNGWGIIRNPLFTQISILKEELKKS